MAAINDSLQHPSQDRADLEMYRRVFHATPDYASFSNLTTGVFIDVNPGFEKLIGYRREEVIGRSSIDINLWADPEERQALQRQLQHSSEIQLVTLRMRTRSGTSILLEASVAIFEMQGETLLIAVGRDITARRRQEEELQRYRSELEQLVAQRTAELQEALEKVNQLAVRDELTGVGNRRALHSQFDSERTLFERLGLDFSVAMLDLDHFKKINDHWGHDIGDAVLRNFADLLRIALRASDCIIRYGGDEFVLLLRGTRLESAGELLQRLCEKIAAYDWHAIAAGASVTTSIGVAMFKRGETLEQTLKRADTALYQAKLAGRNQVAIAQHDGKAGRECRTPDETNNLSG